MGAVVGPDRLFGIRRPRLGSCRDQFPRAPPLGSCVPGRARQRLSHDTTADNCANVRCGEVSAMLRRAWGHRVVTRTLVGRATAMHGTPQNVTAWRRRLRRLDSALSSAYQSPRLGNVKNSTDELLYTLLSNR